MILLVVQSATINSRLLLPSSSSTAAALSSICPILDDACNIITLFKPNAQDSIYAFDELEDGLSQDVVSKAPLAKDSVLLPPKYRNSILNKGNL